MSDRGTSKPVKSAGDSGSCHSSASRGLVFYYMPAMMMSLSEVSPWAVLMALGIFFVLASFAPVIWLRGKRQQKNVKKNRD